MKKQFFTYAAGPFLVAYLLLLLGSSYFSQQSIRQAANNALQANLEKRAFVLSYFHSERINDIRGLAEDHTLKAFFSNRALGMSMEYGLRASLLSMQNEFQKIVENKKLDHAPIYLRLLFAGTDDGPNLVDVGLSSGKDVPWLSPEILQIDEMKFMVVLNGKHIHSILLFPYFYKEKRMGTLIAEINRDEMLRCLIHPQPSENIQYTVFTKNFAYVLNGDLSKQHGAGENDLLVQAGTRLPADKLNSLVRMEVSGTPFILAAWDSSPNDLGSLLTSRGYLVSLVVLAVLVLYSVLIGIRSRTQALLLRTQYDAAENQRRSLNEKNQLLQTEIQKRLSSEVRLKTLIETIPDLVWLKDPKGVYLSCNRKFERFFGASEQEIVGKTDYDFVEKALADFFREKDKIAMRAGKATVNEEEITYADDGHIEVLETIKTPLHDYEGKLVGVLGVAREITARKQAEEEARYYSVHDSLTGLYNRRVLEERLEEEVNRAERYGHDLSVFMLDLDHFKLVNDTYGHKSGDVTLSHFAELLESSIRKTDYVARYGGEEFIVVLPETPLVEARELAERLCVKIEALSIPISKECTIQITASIGVACYPEHNQTWHGLVDIADAAMYAAKQAGRNQVKTALPL